MPSGMDQLTRIFSGEAGYEGIVKTMNIRPVSRAGPRGV
jgi:hypothetical protein